MSLPDWKERREIMEKLAKEVPSNLDRVFEFCTTGMTPPNRMIFGFRAIDQIGAEASKLAKGKVFVVSDEVLQKMGIVDQVKTLLSSEGLTVETFTEVEPEPHIETVEAMYEKCAGNDFSLIVGVGGGSVMDLAKLTAQSVARGVSPRQYLDREVSAEGRGLPLILAPTTSGTGSEVSAALVVAVGQEKRFLISPFYYPDMAIIDPLLTVTMPPAITASTGIDALSHAIEAMLHKNANPISDSFSLTGIELVGTYLRRAVADGEDLDVRYHMSMASTLSMMGMAMTGALYAHSAGYIITKYKPTPHGIGCALGLPYTMAFNQPVSTAKLARIGQALGEQTLLLSQQEASKSAVRSVVDLMKDVGLPVTLKEYGGINEKDLEEMAELMIKLYHRPLNPRPMGRDESIRFWQDMWNGIF
jgi:alcohol dehydrogenase